MTLVAARGRSSVPAAPRGGLALAIVLLAACKGGDVRAPGPAPTAGSIDPLGLSPSSVCTMTGGEMRCRGDDAARRLAGDRAGLLGFVGEGGDAALDVHGLLRAPGYAWWTPRPVPATLDRATLHTSASWCVSDGGGRYACFDVTRGWSTPLPAGAVRATSGAVTAGCLVESTGALRCWEDGAELRPLAGETSLRALAPQSAPHGGCALSEAGEVLCWQRFDRPCSPGEPSRKKGRCDAWTSSRPLPPRLGAAVEVSAASHSCARLADGRVACWGANCQGQLGRGDRSEDGEADLVPGLDNVVALDVVEGVSCASRADGSVWCWGRSEAWGGPRSQFGRPVPVLSGAVALAVGPLQSCAVTADGAVLCWGRWSERHGELDPCHMYAPRRVGGIGAAVAVALADDIACAIEVDGRARCWGEPKSAPWTETAALTLPGATESLALGATICAIQGGRVRCWHVERKSGILSLGPGDEIPLPAPALQIDGAQWGFCAVTEPGEVYCWQLGNGWPEATVTPKRLAASDAVEVRVDRRGRGSSCWRSKRGEVHCTQWTRERRPLDALADATALAMSHDRLCVLRGAAEVVCASYPDEPNAAGAPKTIRLDAPAQAIALGDDHGCALGRDGQVRCWGRRGADEGQIGDGVEPFSRVPVRVWGPTTTTRQPSTTPE